jgi:hypothetical protein
MTNDEAFEQAYDALFRHRAEDMKHSSDCEEIWNAACRHVAAVAREQEAQPRMGTDWEGLPMPLPQSGGRADGKHWLDGFAGANVAAPKADWQRDPLDLVKTIALALERGYAPSDILDENSPIRDRIRLITEEQA